MASLYMSNTVNSRKIMHNCNYFKTCIYTHPKSQTEIFFSLFIFHFLRSAVIVILIFSKVTVLHIFNTFLGIAPGGRVFVPGPG